jgi:hypothetical protein
MLSPRAKSDTSWKIPLVSRMLMKKVQDFPSFLSVAFRFSHRVISGSCYSRLRPGAGFLS